jgi:hypothetical protein
MCTEQRKRKTIYTTERNRMSKRKELEEDVANRVDRVLVVVEFFEIACAEN